MAHCDAFWRVIISLKDIVFHGLEHVLQRSTLQLEEIVRPSSQFHQLLYGTAVVSVVRIYN